MSKGGSRKEAPLCIVIVSPVGLLEKRFGASESGFSRFGISGLIIGPKLYGFRAYKLYCRPEAYSTLGSGPILFRVWGLSSSA